MASDNFEIKGFILDIDYILDKNLNAVIRLAVKSNGKTYEVFDNNFKPYFYFHPDSEIDLLDAENYFKSILTTNDMEKIKNIEIKEMELIGKNIELLKLHTSSTLFVPLLKQSLQKYGTCYEADIPFAKRYLIDKNILSSHMYSFLLEKDNDVLTVKEINKIEDINLNNNILNSFNVLCFDIETYNPNNRSNPKNDPVIMISYYYFSASKTEQKVITYKKISKPFIEYVEDEKQMILRFISIINELDADIVTGYNSSNFDIKYLIERSHALKIDFNISRFKGQTKIERHGMSEKVKLSGRAHIDMYNVVKFIATVSASTDIFRLNSYTLKNVYESISKTKKQDIDKANIFRIWDGSEEERMKLAEYNLSDSFSLYKVFETFFPLILQLSSTIGETLSNVSVSTTGQLVEFLLMKYAYQFNQLIPNKPNEYEIKQRLANPITGAYVKTPEPGIYHNLVIFDFRSLYPSIITSHNIDPSAICTACTDYHESPDGTKFDKKKTAIIPFILSMLLKERLIIKKQYKQDKNSVILGAKSQAIKIISNSFYGYLGYTRSRWYSRECASSVTAYARFYINQVIESAEANGFKVLYSDTDSIAINLENNSREHVLEFVSKYNSKLPESMELELEDFYKTAVFVSKKTKQEKGAKKKYAMISESGAIKIRGFELVRRDWSKIARNTQQLVLETILKQGSVDEVIKIIKNIINKINSGDIELSDMVINTHLRKSIDNYDIISPEVAAARKAVKQGFKTKQEIQEGNIGYIVTKSGESISDKALLEGMAKDYDPDYYINNQIIPAVMKILKELNITEQQIKNLGKQKKL